MGLTVPEVTGEGRAVDGVEELADRRSVHMSTTRWICAKAPLSHCSSARIALSKISCWKQTAEGVVPLFKSRDREGKDGESARGTRITCVTGPAGSAGRVMIGWAEGETAGSMREGRCDRVWTTVTAAKLSQLWFSTRKPWTVEVEQKKKDNLQGASSADG